ncbi:ADP-ribosylglycohydrolase family protein [Catenibacterium faecis]|uniref:ADP-ribosylglycohydrolase family protein n=1 Tax=Catenibacterium faecis TaxID=2764323 RepID=A0ABR7KD09_9FIRM|nr:ADP-ribosylglycohydrolase family protein [Catenibacterium faecis]MBC6010598.1 ADP-ribosylglycohydrolase family protein [Catenibacterium faecis]
MYGAILGDIIGSPFEFDRGDKTKDFKLFSRRSHFTDDSVMTLAVCEALLKVGQNAAVKEIEDAVITSMQSWGRRYPHEGYGGYFRHWLTARRPEPYNSFGNGSAMRVSAAGWLYDSLEKTRVVAKATANVTHNHPEGIKGAEATASAIFMARNGSSKEEIKKYIENEFHYDLNRTLDEIRPNFHMDETCQKTVPEAIIAFLEARDFEDAIRNAVSLGGDTDTLGAITGSIAESYFGISETLISECRNRINKDMRDVVDAFYSFVRKDDSPNTNQMIEKAIDQYYVHNDKEGMLLFMDTLLNAIKQGGELVVPYITKNPFLSKEQLSSINIGDTFTLDHDVKLKMETVKDMNGKEWLGVFTSSNEMHKGSSGNVQISQSILSILKLVIDWKEIYGIVINPFGKYMQISKAMILLLISIYEEHE